MAKSKVAEQADQIKNGKPIKDDERVDFLSSGSTMLNLAGAGKGKTGGWARGRISNIIGDGSSGKTVLALEAAAWYYYNVEKIKSEIFAPVKKFSIVYNNVEGVMDFPVAKMYNRKDEQGNPIPSFCEAVDWVQKGTVEAFGRDYARRVMALKDGESLLYIVDSWDALTSEKGKERFEEAARKDEEEAAAYGTEKAKYGSSSFFSNICDISKGKDATLIIISQVRSKIDAMTFGKKKYRAGGGALDFYTHQCAWLAVKQDLEKTFRGDKRSYGIKTRVKFERNKVAKPDRESETTILFNYGVDDISSMIDWYWGPKADKINFDDADFTREDFIKYIEDGDLRDVLADVCEKEWLEIEKAIEPKRKSRF